MEQLSYVPHLLEPTHLKAFAPQEKPLTIRSPHTTSGKQPSLAAPGESLCTAAKDPAEQKAKKGHDPTL